MRLSISVVPRPDEINVIAYVVDGETPLAMTLYGFGSYRSVATLQAEGLLADFETMAASLLAPEDDPSAIVFPILTETEASLNVLGTEPLDTSHEEDVLFNKTQATSSYVQRSRSRPQGGYHCHGDVCGYDEKTWQTIRWDGAGRVIIRLYEAYWYRHSNLRALYLLNAHVSDRSTWCDDFTAGYLHRPIGKGTNRNQYKVSDDWWPYYRNRSVGSQTFHGETYGDPAIFFCTDWRPFF